MFKKCTSYLCHGNPHMSLIRSLYRSVLKQVNKVHHHYGNDVSKTSRSIFGSAVSPEYWQSFGSHPKHAIRHYFTYGWPSSVSTRTRTTTVFEFLKKLNVAIGDSEKDTHCIQKLPLYRGRLTFEVPSYVEDEPPPPRLTVDGDVFWNTQLCLPNQLFPWREALAWSPTNPNGSLDGLCNTTTTDTNHISIQCSTRLVAPAGKVSPHHVFEYTITIKNMADAQDPSAAAIQLLSRHWYFLDWDRCTVAEVWGKGAAGQYPILMPGESHTYSSGTDLLSGHGIMRGCFQFARFTRPSPRVESIGTDGKHLEQVGETSGDDPTPPAPILLQNTEQLIDMVDAAVGPTLLTSSTRASDFFRVGGESSATS